MRHTIKSTLLSALVPIAATGRAGAGATPGTSFGAQVEMWF
jgi:hypothetical protein